jgi:hypothetical protein
MMRRYEVRCRTLLRAYPRRYRAVREAELLATLLDAAEPGRDLPPLRDSWDIVRGGLLTRWREHPPALRWLGYRFLELRLPPRWQAWVRDDVLGRTYFLRVALAAVMIYALGMAVVNAGVILITGSGLSLFEMAIYPLGAFAGTLFGGRTRHRRRVLGRHGLAPDGTPVPAPLFPVVLAPASRRRVWHLLLAPALPLLVAAPFVALALLFPYDGRPADDAAHGDRGYDVIENLGGIGPVLGWTCGAAFAVAVALVSLGVIRLPRRLCWRDLGGANAATSPAEVFLAVLTGALSTLAALAVVVATYLHGIAVIVPLAVIVAGIALGLPLAVVGLILEDAERRTGVIVTVTETAWAVFALPGAPPPTATRPVPPYHPAVNPYSGQSGYEYR